jgi:hypothetical protein
MPKRAGRPRRSAWSPHENHLTRRAAQRVANALEDGRVGLGQADLVAEYVGVQAGQQAENGGAVLGRQVAAHSQAQTRCAGLLQHLRHFGEEPQACQLFGQVGLDVGQQMLQTQLGRERGHRHVARQEWQACRALLARPAVGRRSQALAVLDHGAEGICTSALVA